MSKPVFRINSPDEETRVFFVNGKEMQRVDHDSGGWQGMEDAENLFTAIATELGIKVEHTEDEDS